MEADKRDGRCYKDAMATMLVPVDFSGITDAVVREAVDLAKATGSSIVLLHVARPEPDFIGYTPGPQSVRDKVAEEYRAEHREIQAMEKAVRDQGVEASALLVQGFPVEKIVAEADRLKATRIILGSHGHSALHNLLVGSVADGVLRHAHCPVVVVPARHV